MSGSGIVCPYLVGVDGSLIERTPLGQFQWTPANKDDTLSLIQSINQSLGDQAHNAGLIAGNFNSQWSKLKRKLDKLVAESPPVQGTIDEAEPTVEEQLSAEARILLVEASEDPSGRVIKAVSLAGTEIATNRRGLVTDQIPGSSPFGNRLWMN